MYKYPILLDACANEMQRQGDSMMSKWAEVRLAPPAQQAAWELIAKLTACVLASSACARRRRSGGALWAAGPACHRCFPAMHSTCLTESCVLTLHAWGAGDDQHAAQVLLPAARRGAAPGPGPAARAVGREGAGPQGPVPVMLAATRAARHLPGLFSASWLLTDVQAAAASCGPSRCRTCTDDVCPCRAGEPCGRSAWLR